MHVDAMLCNHAETNGNLLYLSGGGIEVASVPPGSLAPFVTNLAVGIMITVPWASTNKQHSLLVEVVDEDGQHVTVPTRDPGEPQQFITAAMGFNVGRPPGLVAGDEQHVALAVNFGALPLPRVGAYVFRISIDDTEMRSLRYRIAALPGGGIAGPVGPGQPG